MTYNEMPLVPLAALSRAPKSHTKAPANGIEAQ